MSDEQRGAYTPSQDMPLEFDPRRPAGRRPAPVALLASGAVLTLVVLGGALVYSRGVRGESEPPRPVGEPIAQLKTAPAAGAQPQDGDVDVSAPQNVPAQAPVFAPPPELPRARPAPVAAPAAAPASRLRIVTADAAPPAPPPAQRLVRVAAAPLPTAGAPGSARLPVQTLAPGGSRLAAAAAPSAAPYPSTVAPAPVAPALRAAPASRSGLEARAAAPSAPAGALPSAGRQGGAVQVQIGAFSSAGLADKGWSDVAALLPTSIGGKGKHVEKVDRNGQTLYRTSVTGFSTRETASAFCDALKAKGKICFVKS